MVDDLIKRQYAIDAIENITWYHQNANKDMICGANSEEHQAWYKVEDVYKALNCIPSAQPEIIRCNDCKHWTQTTGNMRGFGLGDCDYINAKLVNCNGFCYWAERREE